MRTGSKASPKVIRDSYAMSSDPARVRLHRVILTFLFLPVSDTRAGNLLAGPQDMEFTTSLLFSHQSPSRTTA